MGLTPQEMEERVKLIHETRELIYDLKKAEPISCYKVIGDAFVDFGKITPVKLIQLSNSHKDVAMVTKMQEQKDFMKAIVVGCDYVILFFNDDNAVVFTNTKFVKAINEIFMCI